MPNPPDYDDIERDLCKQFCQEVMEAAQNEDSPWLMDKIAKFSRKWGYSQEDVLRQLKSNEIFSTIFAKDPRRTGFHEKVAAEWVKALPHVRDFKVLNKGGQSALKVSSDGNIELGNGHRNLPGKSLDFRWTTGDTTFYAMHKYTKEGGGNQDSQYQEMIELMKRFHRCNDPNIALIVIVDGDYYQEGNGVRLSKLRHHQRTTAPKSHALSIGELPRMLEQYINE